MAEHGPLVDVPYSGDDLAHWVERETAQRGRTRGSATIRHLVESLSRERSAREASERALEEARRKAAAFDALSEPGTTVRVAMMATKNCPNPPTRRYAEVTLAAGAHASRTSGRASLLEAVEAAASSPLSESVPHVD